MGVQTKYFTNGGYPDIDASGPAYNSSLTLAYRTFGDPKNPAILIPSCFYGTLEDTLPFLCIPSENGIPPVLENYFVVVCGLLGAGESSSPSNAPRAQHGPNFPAITYEDNIRLQYETMSGARRNELAAYIGFSMGGQQAYHMAALYPDFVLRIVVLAGSARTSPKAALMNSVDFHDGKYETPAIRGSKAFSRVYSTWALSQAWFRERCWETLGFRSLEEYLDTVWGGGADAHDLLVQVETWQKGDITLYGPEEERGDLPKALSRIKAKVLLMPSRTDMYFTLEDSEEELKHLNGGELQVIENIWGHAAGGGSGTKDDIEFIKGHVKRFLES